jgi:hypothetical protein
VVETFWGARDLDERGEPLALAIVHTRSHQKFLIHGNSFFGSPIWREHEVPLHLARRSSNKAKGLLSHVSLSRRDALVVGTEAGIETFLYFDGSKYAYYEPPDEP